MCRNGARYVVRCPAIATVPGAPGNGVDARDPDAADRLAAPGLAPQRPREERHAPALGVERPQRGEIGGVRARELEPPQVVAEAALHDLRVQRRHRLLPGDRQRGVDEHERARDDQHARQRAQRPVHHRPFAAPLIAVARTPCRPGSRGRRTSAARAR